ncbi:Ribonuclease H-like domain containing protein [Parasponia andersonii]|uniref:Ribonuclease H-like domain containing protein n=1 Tax=Parasponia andersonii TaxID=3476 RepID=A0A2P5DZV9_PARAD|nr:Ribonuclease H-like domain containing protein [Parasponia andersonii]
MGSSPHLSLDGFRYYVHFIDDYTKYTWIFPLKQNSEAYQIFVDFNMFVERQFDKKKKLSPFKLIGVVNIGVFFLYSTNLGFNLGIVVHTHTNKMVKLRENICTLLKLVLHFYHKHRCL